MNPAGDPIRLLSGLAVRIPALLAAGLVGFPGDLQIVWHRLGGWWPATGWWWRRSTRVGSLQVFRLGTTAGGSAVTLVPESLDFGSQPAGTTSPPQSGELTIADNSPRSVRVDRRTAAARRRPRPGHHEGWTEPPFLGFSGEVGHEARVRNPALGRA